MVELTLKPQIQNPNDPALMLADEKIIMLPVLELLIEDIVKFFIRKHDAFQVADQFIKSHAVG